MARQRGIIKLEGTIADINFYRTADGYMAKENVTPTKERIKSDPAFARTRENAAEFGRAGKAGKVLRNAVRVLLEKAKDRRVTSRLTAEFMKVIKADATSIRGQRNVIDGEAELLQGFDFNINAKLETTLFTPFTSDINRVAGTLTSGLASFKPTEAIAAPDGTTHFKVVSLAAEVDFEQETFVTDTKESAVLPWDGNATAAINLVSNVTPNSTHPLFLLLGIQFFQMVNGVEYPLKNGSYNALRIVNVQGM